MDGCATHFCCPVSVTVLRPVMLASEVRFAQVQFANRLASSIDDVHEKVEAVRVELQKPLAKIEPPSCSIVGESDLSSCHASNFTCAPRQPSFFLVPVGH